MSCVSLGPGAYSVDSRLFGRRVVVAARFRIAGVTHDSHYRVSELQED